MPTFESFVGTPKLPKLGQGFRGRLPGGGGPGPLRAPPGIPHIQRVQRPPNINYGAVAQVGRQPRTQPPSFPRGNPLAPRNLLPQGFGPLPVTKLPKLSGAERQAIKAIHQSYAGNFKDPGRKANQLIFNPTPKMQVHINNMVGGNIAHRMAIQDAQQSPSWTKPVDQALKAGGRQYQREMADPVKRQKILQQRALDQQPMTEGFGSLGLGGVGNYLQKSVGTPLAQLGTGFGPGVADLAVHGYKGLANLDYAAAHAAHLPAARSMPRYSSQTPYFRNMAGTIGHSYKQTALHPLWDLQHPVEASLNILPFVTGGASLAAKAGDIAEIAGSADLSATEKAAQIAARLRAPHGIERRIITGVPDQHFDNFGFDSMGFHKEDHVPPDHLGGQHFPRMPIYANTKNPADSIFGPPGLSHADITPAHGPHGHIQASGIIEDGKVAKINLHGKGGGLSPAEEKVLVAALRHHANNKLDEAGRMSLHSITPPAAKSALGAYIQGGLDKATERAMAGDTGIDPKVRAFGKYYALPRPTIARLQGRWGKLARRDLEMRTQMERGVAEQRILKEMQDVQAAPRPLTQEMAAKDIHPAEAQRQAYAEGAAKVHAEEWHNLYNGGLGANDHILNNLEDYVAVKKPQSREDILKNSKAYSSERNIARQWNSMVVSGEKAHDVILESPHDYSFIPKKAFDKMKPVPSEMMQGVGKFLQPMDNVTQVIRSGRFLTPAYFQWAVQNGILHLSQAGMYAFRNFSRVRSELPKLSPEDRAAFENAVGSGHFGGGITRASAGGEESKLLSGKVEKLRPIRKYKDFAAKAARFWHAIDDAPFRNASFVHELARYGYHDAADYSKLLHQDPQRFRMIARQAQREAIDYSEMSPAERATFQKIFTAWGWTRGASSFAGRFPFQHPFQATIGAQLARHGEQVVNAPYEKAGGMVPDWLSSYLPVGHGGLVDTNVISPFSTPADLMKAMGGVTHGQTQNLAGLEAPAPSTIEEWALGQTKYGQPLRGNQRVTTPIQDLINRFKPVGVYHTLVGSKKGGGTFQQSRLGALEQLMGVPYEKLTDLKKAAALGMKDYEQNLSMPDEIQFRYNHGMSQLPQEMALYEKKTGTKVPPSTISAIKGDMTAVERRDMFQYQYAHARGANSFRTLPPVDRFKAGVQFMHDHGYWSKADAAQALQQSKVYTTDPEMADAASQIWGSLTIGQYVTQWKAMMKAIQPTPLQAGRG